MRGGSDIVLKDSEGLESHTLGLVYREMLLTICSHYRSLPDPRTLTLCEIRFFFNGMRKELRAMTAPKPVNKK